MSRGLPRPNPRPPTSYLTMNQSTNNAKLEPSHVSPKHYHSPPQSATFRGDHVDDHEGWSGGESDSQGNGDSSRKRKRPMSVSCELCKQRKVKCDRGQPTCGWCSRNGHICEYKERKKPGLRAGYGRELESRLDRLEAVIRSQALAISQLSGGAVQTMQLSPQDNANVFSHQSPSQVGQGSGQESSYQQTPATAYTPQTPGMPDFRDPPSGFSSSYQPATQEMSFQPQAPNMLPQTPQPYYTNNSQPLGSPNLTLPDRPPTVSIQDHDFPPYDLLYGLADLYFKHINTWCPILHRHTTIDTLFGASSLDEADRILLHAIVATTLRFSTDARLTEERKEKYHSISKQKVLLYGLENSSVKAVQALVILALDVCGASIGPPGWNLIALITRSAVQLGLSLEMTSSVVAPRVPSIYTIRAMVLSEPKDWIEDEARRRLFWMVYVLDRYTTIATAFEFALDDREIDRTLPCRDDLFAKNQPVETKWFDRNDRYETIIDNPENLGSFSYYIEIVGILSRIHLFLKKPIDISSQPDVEKWRAEYRELYAVLSNWHMNLPKEYASLARLFESSRGNKNVNCGWVMLHATYQTTIIRLHSSAAYPTNRSPIFNPSYTASQHCLTAVDSISSLCTFVTQTALLPKLGPLFAFSVWVAARLLLVHSSTIDHSINPTIHLFLQTLRQLGRYWAVADRYATLLQRVLDEYHDSERAPHDAEGVRATPSTVKILADMRRCAYDLDFLISRQPTLAQQHIQRDALSSVNSNGVLATAIGRPPAPNELEYLDVFDFFNMPRLPVNVVSAPATQGELQQGAAVLATMEGDAAATAAAAVAAANGGGQLQGARLGEGLQLAGSNEFNITNFMMNTNADWFGDGA